MTTTLDTTFLDNARLNTAQFEREGRTFTFHSADAYADYRGAVLALSEGEHVIGYLSAFEGREMLAVKAERIDLNITNPIVTTAESAIDSIAF
jgi:hypothetical protein